MKQIENYRAKKYANKAYTEVEKGIYKYEIIYVTSLSFVQEPELGEGENAADISQYPIEDLAMEYQCYISDFYDKLNKAKSQKCYLEFASLDIEDLRKLRTIIGKHVYNKEDGEYVELVVE